MAEWLDTARGFQISLPRSRDVSFHSEPWTFSVNRFRHWYLGLLVKKGEIFPYSASLTTSSPEFFGSSPEFVAHSDRIILLGFVAECDMHAKHTPLQYENAHWRKRGILNLGINKVCGLSLEKSKSIAIPRNPLMIPFLTSKSLQTKDSIRNKCHYVSTTWMHVKSSQEVC